MDGTYRSRIAGCRSIFMVGLCGLLVLAQSPQVGYAQTVTTNITSSGLNTTVVPSGSTTNIRGGTLSSNNSNLFHSFGEFSIAQGETAAFQNLNAQGTAPLVETASSVANIVGRVTGTNPSSIFGTINSRNGFPSANLFLINPRGIVFGPGASIDVGGAVHFSTADYLRLGTGSEFFYADLAKNSTLSSAPVTAFGFLGASPVGTQAIKVDDSATVLSMASGQSLALVGRDTMNGGEVVPGILNEAIVFVPGGRISLMSVGTPLDPVAGGEVSAVDFNPAAASSGHGFATLGRIHMTSNAAFSVGDSSGPAAGQIVIRGGQLAMEQGSRLLARTTDANTVQGGIDINVTGAMTLSGGSSIDSQVVGSAAIPGGGILIRAGSLTVTEGSQITAINSSGHANAVGGSIDITADTVMLSGAIDGGGNTAQSGLFSGATRTSSGASGRIRVTTNELSVLDGAAIDTSTFSDAHAGDIDIAATTVLVSGVGKDGVTSPSSTISSRATWDRQADNPNDEQQNTGNGGNIRIQTTSLDIRDGGQLNASTETAGKAGTIDVTADTITIAGGRGVLRSGIFTESSNSGSTAGAGGNVRLTATSLLDLSDGAEIVLDTRGAGAAGTLNVSAGRINLTSGSQIASGTISSGPAGNLSLTAGSLTVQDSVVSTRSFGSGNAGTIAISAGNVTVNGPTAKIDSSTNTISQNAGSGGNIVVTASNTLAVQEGTITTSTASVGNAGTVQVTADQVLLSGGGTISSNTTNTGAGGTVSVVGTGPTGLVQLNGGSIKAATTGSGPAGNIIVAGNTVNVSGAASSIDSSTTGTGNAGSIQVQAGQVTLANDGTISSASVAPATGNAGSVAISATDQFQSTGGKVTTSADNGQGGDITVRSGDIALTSDSTIAASSNGLQDAGNIVLAAGDRILVQDSTVRTSATQASGGNISLQASNLVRLRNGQIISSVQGGPATSGGDIAIDPQAVLLQNNSQILAQAFQGNGGNISIVAGVLIADPGTRIDATSQLGISGQVSVQAPIQNLAGVIAPLPQSFVSSATLYGQRCAAQKGGQFSSFVQGTRDGLPVQPGEFIPSPLVLDLPEIPPGQTGTSAQPNLAAARLGLDPASQLFSTPFLLFSACRA